MEWSITERVLHRKDQLHAMEKLLEQVDLTLPQGVQYSIGLYDGTKLVGCGSRKDDILQGLAIHPDYHGEGLAVRLVTNLIQQAATQGINHLYVFTKSTMARLIASMGFRTVADASPYVVLLEYGPGGVEQYKVQLHELARRYPSQAAGIVMNCNPFTKGHRYLIEHASKNSPFVYVFIVEEDVSQFPFADRLRLVTQGVADLKNVVVIPGGKYIISNLTFPSYFTRQENLAKAQSTLDAILFATVVAPALGIKKRYVGSEPYSAVTNIYNETLLAELPPRGIQVEQIARICLGEEAISASRVRRHLEEGDWQAAAKLLPEVTRLYLYEKYGN